MPLLGRWLPDRPRRQPPAADAHAEVAAPEPDAEPSPDAATSLLARWIALSELKRRAFLAISREVDDTSGDVERSAIDLSRDFQALADAAGAQLGRVETVIGVAQSMEVDGREVTIGDVTQFVEGVLARVIDTILNVSQYAMRMVGSLDEVTGQLAKAEKCVAEMHHVNRQTRFLALNAAIEAARTGAQSGAFKVIAHEIDALSTATDANAKAVTSFLADISGSVARSEQLLREIATVDMTEHIAAKERLRAMLGGLMKQNRDFHAVLSETAAASTALSGHIGALVMSLQFQDRTSQRLAHVVEAIATLEEAGEALRHATMQALPEGAAADGSEAAVIERIIERQTLGEVRKRFLAHLLEGGPDAESPAAEPSASSPEGGDIELF